MLETEDSKKSQKYTVLLISSIERKEQNIITTSVPGILLQIKNLKEEIG